MKICRLQKQHLIHHYHATMWYVNKFLNQSHRKRRDFIFLFKGQPVKDVKTALKAACERAGIPYGRNTPNGITFHSLRHSFGSLAQQTQRDIRITQQLMNHKSIQMTERYTHSRSEAKMEAVNSIDWGLHKEKSPMSVNVS